MGEKLRPCPNPSCKEKPQMFHNAGHSQFHVACVNDDHTARGEIRRTETEAVRAWNGGMVIMEEARP